MRTRLIAVLVALAAMAVFTTEASAMYHAGMGVFMQRDPGAGTGGPARMGAGGAPAATGRFIPRDPTGQYADGMNLYQYVRSSPVNWVDPEGTKCCIKSVEFRHSYKPVLTRWENPNPNAPSSFDAPGGNFRVFLWRLQQRIEIRANLTKDSDPKDCALRQSAQRRLFVVRTKNTQVPGTVKKPGDWEFDWPVKNGKPQVGADWDLVEYGDHWVKWWDEPGFQFMSEVDLDKVQEFDFYHSHEFKTHIYDKSANTVRWMGHWWSIIDAEVHIKWTKAVKEGYSQCLTGLLKTQLAPTKDIVFRR